MLPLVLSNSDSAETAWKQTEILPEKYAVHHTPSVKDPIAQNGQVYFTPKNLRPVAFPYRLVANRMHLPAFMLWHTGCVRLYQDVPGLGWVFKSWHPVTWILLVFAIPICGLLGQSIGKMIPLKLNPVWDEDFNKDKLQWATPWTLLRDLRTVCIHSDYSSNYANTKNLEFSGFYYFEKTTELN